MRRNRFLAILLVFAMCLFAGCTNAKEEKVISETSVVFEKGNTICYYLVEDFDKDYYNLNELQDMAKKEAADYNLRNISGDKDAVTILSVERLEGDSSKVVVTYRFRDDDSFCEFLGETIFYGTVEEAFEKGYSFRGQLQGISKKDTLSEIELKQMKSKKLIITDLKTKLYCDDKIDYATSGCMVLSDGSLDISNVEGKAVIVLK